MVDCSICISDDGCEGRSFGIVDIKQGWNKQIEGVARVSSKRLKRDINVKIRQDDMPTLSKIRFDDSDEEDASEEVS
ncbi:hypothetical protein Tco_0952370 [Tanacetum coccineum]|uniref:Uncharacterized protein n=1 Tax=Tanacetum coccineum TaxID=301880 RepID=A0ABQ5DWS3_9ASTR